MRFRTILILITVCQGYTLTAQELGLSLFPSVQTIVAGQPVIEILTIKNESSEPVTIWNDREHLTVDVTGPSKKHLALPQVPPPLQTLVFGITIAPGSTERLEIAVTEVANAAETGDYVVAISAAGFNAATDCHVTVQPYNADTLSQWAQETTEEILRRPRGEVFELVKALCSLRPEIAEPYLCRLMIRSEAAAVPAVVDRLKEFSTAPAAKCLISALAIYSDDVDKQYIVAALKTVQKTTNNPEIREQVGAALAKEPQN